MALLAPRKSLDSFGVDPNGYWRPSLGSAGSYWTRSGEVTHDTALNLSAVWAATRVICDTLMMLPIEIVEKTGEKRTVRTDHPLAKVLNVAPNGEQSSPVYRDQQQQFVLNWGNCFAEIEWDADQNVAALWPIHPVRIPKDNIRRRGDRRSDGDTDVSQPGGLVYYIKQKRGPDKPIAKRNILHIPGVMPENGLFGRGVVQAGAASIGLASMLESSVQGLHSTGMSNRVVLKHPKRMGPEKAAELRAQWAELQKERNRTVLLEDGMDLSILSINPEQAELLASREFGIKEIARWYRIPPHLLADMAKATWGNLESENLSFLQNTITPWIVRWEKELERQLLKPEEQGRFQVKFNVNALLRADSAARMALFKGLFDIGAISRNEIRAREDMDPVDGGDTYFIANNNYAPLDDEGQPVPPEPVADPLAPEPTGEPDEPTEQAIEAGRLIERNAETEKQLRAATRDLLAGMWGDLIAYEVRSVRSAADKPGQFPTWANEFYDGKFLKGAANIVTRLEGPVARLGGTFARLPMEHGFASLERLTALYDTPTSAFAEAVKAETETWSRRADEFADAVMGVT